MVGSYSKSVLAICKLLEFLHPYRTFVTTVQALVAPPFDLYRIVAELRSSASLLAESECCPLVETLTPLI